MRSIVESVHARACVCVCVLVVYQGGQCWLADLTNFPMRQE